MGTIRLNRERVPVGSLNADGSRHDIRHPNLSHKELAHDFMTWEVYKSFASSKNHRRVTETFSVFEI